MFGGGARGQQQQQDQFAQQLEDTQNQILKGMYARAQQKYFPLEDIGLEGLTQRAKSLPAYARGALTEARTLSEPMDLSY